MSITTFPQLDLDVTCAHVHVPRLHVRRYAHTSLHVIPSLTSLHNTCLARISACYQIQFEGAECRRTNASYFVGLATRCLLPGRVAEDESPFTAPCLPYHHSEVTVFPRLPRILLAWRLLHFPNSICRWVVQQPDECLLPASTLWFFPHCLLLG
ncbi:hypothetical protein J6590_027343 [Homalodisca vitripennis]|nr:hypothetical protein J6590_027343 [Homalodisca vitripennis]